MNICLLVVTSKVISVCTSNMWPSCTPTRELLLKAPIKKSNHPGASWICTAPAELGERRNDTVAPCQYNQTCGVNDSQLNPGHYCTFVLDEKYSTGLFLKQLIWIDIKKWFFFCCKFCIMRKCRNISLFFVPKPLQY